VRAFAPLVGIGAMNQVVWQGLVRVCVPFSFFPRAAAPDLDEGQEAAGEGRDGGGGFGGGGAPRRGRARRGAGSTIVSTRGSSAT